MRTYVVGDTHGCFYTLLDLMNKLPMESRDKLIFLGDYIDRGPHSKQVVEYVKKLTDAKQAVALRGNHEQMCIDNYDGSGHWGHVWIQNGGGTTIDSYDTRTKDEKRRPAMSDKEAYDQWLSSRPMVSNEHIEWMKSLPLMHHEDQFIYVHAGIPPGISIDRFEADLYSEDVLWIRNEFILSDYNWGKVIVFGHTALKEVLQQPNKIGLDTGCVYGEKLSAMCMDSRQIFSVPKHNKDKKFR